MQRIGEEVAVAHPAEKGLSDVLFTGLGDFPEVQFTAGKRPGDEVVMTTVTVQFRKCSTWMMLRQTSQLGRRA